MRSVARGVALHPDRHGPGAAALAAGSGLGNGTWLPVRDGRARHLGNWRTRRSFRTDFGAAGRRRRRSRVRLFFPAPAETGAESTGGGARGVDRARRGPCRRGASLAAPGFRRSERRDQRPGARRRHRCPVAGRRDQDHRRPVAQHPDRSRRSRRQLPGAGSASGRLLRRGERGRLRDLRGREPDPGGRRRAEGGLPHEGRQRVGAGPRLLALARRGHRQRRERPGGRRPAAVARSRRGVQSGPGLRPRRPGRGRRGQRLAARLRQLPDRRSGERASGTGVDRNRSPLGGSGARLDDGTVGDDGRSPHRPGHALGRDRLAG